MSEELSTVETKVEDKKKYDKPRIASTIVIGVFLIIGVVLALTFVGFTWGTVNQMVEEAKNSSDDPAGQVAGAGVVALVGVIGVVLIFLVYIGVTIAMSICLPFAIKNRKSTLKPIRIISYVMDGLIGSTLLLSIIKMLLFLLKV